MREATKLTALSIFALQVAKVLSEPGRIVNGSPIWIG
jgi:hypothetical protein